MFPEKYVRVFPETRTRICENTYVFWETNNEIVKTFRKIYNNPMAGWTWKNFLPSRKNGIFHEQIH